VRRLPHVLTAAYGTKRTYRDNLLFDRFRGQSGHQPQCQRLLASPADDYMQSSGGHGLDCRGNVSLPKMGRGSSHKNSFSNVCVGMLVTDADT
jgi:hypothetical protein